MTRDNRGQGVPRRAFLLGTAGVVGTACGDSSGTDPSQIGSDGSIGDANLQDAPSDGSLPDGASHDGGSPPVITSDPTWGPLPKGVEAVKTLTATGLAPIVFTSDDLPDTCVLEFPNTLRWTPPT